MSSIVVFQKDPYFDAVFRIPDDVERVLATEELPYDNRLIVLEPIDLGIFTPVAAFVWPFIKTHEIGIRQPRFPNNGDSAFGIPRLWDILASDLDNDGCEEIIVYWMNYGGGISATVFPLVLNFADPDRIAYETFPLLTEDDGDDGTVSLFQPGDYVFHINGDEVSLPCTRYDTDCYWNISDLDSDSAPELLVAFPQDNGEYHYGPQSWIIAGFSYAGRRFVPEPHMAPFVVPKSEGYGLPEMHGYSFIPDFGMIFYMWMPSWMELESQAKGLTKARGESVSVRLMAETGRRQNENRDKPHQ